MGAVSKHLAVHHPRRGDRPSTATLDMNSNGNGRNVTCFGNQIHPSSSLSPKSHRDGTSRPPFRYSIIISIGVCLRLPRCNHDSSLRNRFDIDDRKGLEIVMLTALLTFQDSNDQYHSPRDEPALPPFLPLHRSHRLFHEMCRLILPRQHRRQSLHLKQDWLE